MRNAKLDPAVAADLDALDAALAGEREDLEVAIIADEVRSAAEPMPPGLALRLEAAAAEGFARPASSRPRRGWTWAPAAGVLGAVALVAVIAGGDGSGGRESFTDGGGSAGQSAAESAAPGSSAGRAVPLPQIAADSTVPGAVAPGAPRRVQRAAELTIATPPGDLQRTSDEVVRTTDRLGGFVQRSDVAMGQTDGSSTFDLRIPAARLDDALAALSELGSVTNRSQRSQDITGRFTSSRARLVEARTERQALLRALAEATTEQEIDSINGRLEIVRSRIGAARADLFRARRAANLSRLSVTVLGTNDLDGAATPSDGGGWTPGEAIGDAVDVLAVAAAVLIVGLAGAIPAALVLALLALGVRAWRRRSRNLALGGSPV